MLDSSLASSLLTGGGVAGVFCILFILGRVFPKSVVDDKDKVIAEKDRRIDLLTAQVAEGTTALSAAKDVIASLQQGLIMAGRFPPGAWQPAGRAPDPPALPGGGHAGDPAP